MASTVVSAQRLSRRYRSGQVGLESTELEVGAGESVALIGPNGSGKTTFLRLLATDLAPSSGLLSILGQDARVPTPELRRSIGYAPDEPVHFDALTGAENLRYFRAMAGRDPGDGVERMVETLGLAGALDQPVSGYSFGMRRRLLLAATLSGFPPLLLLDEPALGLDPSGVTALGVLLRAAAEHGSAVVFATNEVRDIPEWASRIVFLHQGRIMADGTVAELMALVEGRTILTLRVAGPVPDLTRGDLTRGDLTRGDLAAAELTDDLTLVEEIEEVGTPGDRGDRSIRVESPRGAMVLPALLQRVLDAGGEIRNVHVREPDLRDAFRHFTGEDLEGLEGRLDPERGR